jgi:hypothetical protein
MGSKLSPIVVFGRGRLRTWFDFEVSIFSKGVRQVKCERRQFVMSLNRM